jgi:cell wall-associated NlpC family hydrolase
MRSRGLFLTTALGIAMCASTGFSLVATYPASAAAAHKAPPKVNGPPVVPAAATPLLGSAVRLASEIVHDQHAVMAAAEQYDEEEVALTQAQQRVVATSRQLEVSDAGLVAARGQLRQAVIEVYVTDSGASTQGTFLTSSIGQSQSVSVYSGVSLDRLNQAVAVVSQLVDRIAAARAARIADVATARSTLVAIAAARVSATAASATAEHQLAGVEQQLTKLAGATKAATLLEMVAGQAKFKGPFLAGKDVGKVATPAEGLLAVKGAEKLLGVPYVWGGASRAGVDCSGLVMLAWASAGISLEHGATAMWEESRPVPVSKLKPGDLLFYHFSDDGAFPITHVVMYVGSGPFGPETAIQAAEPGTVVSFVPIYFFGFVSAGQP